MWLLASVRHGGIRPTTSIARYATGSIAPLQPPMLEDIISCLFNEVATVVETDE